MTTPEYLEYLMRPIETDDSVPPMDSWGTQLAVSWQRQSAATKWGCNKLYVMEWRGASVAETANHFKMSLLRSNE